MKEVEPEKKNLEKVPFSWKRFWIEIAISFGILMVIWCVPFCIEYFTVSMFDSQPIRLFGDAFFVSGILGLCFFLLIIVSQAGAFDMIVYSVKKLWSYFLHKNPEKGHIPETYYDYVVEKRGKPHKTFWGFLSVASLFFVIGLILSLISYYLE